jgi:hypothetical protein
VLMATGRDATDCAITTSFGRARLINFQVTTDEVRQHDLKHRDSHREARREQGRGL